MSLLRASSGAENRIPGMYRGFSRCYFWQDFIMHQQIVQLLSPDGNKIGAGYDYHLCTLHRRS